MSKSGLFAHFGSKEELQLATVDYAQEVFAVEVLFGAADTTGIERLRRLAENFLRHVENRTYPGGCFFASASVELATQSGPVRERVLKVENDFIARLRAAAHEAKQGGALGAGEDPDQLGFEVTAFLALANMQFAISQDAEPINRARRALDLRLAAAAA
jgi:AcrR family transcriptional regulator